MSADHPRARPPAKMAPMLVPPTMSTGMPRFLEGLHDSHVRDPASASAAKDQSHRAIEHPARQAFGALRIAGPQMMQSRDAGKPPVGRSAAAGGSRTAGARWPGRGGKSDPLASPCATIRALRPDAGALHRRRGPRCGRLAPHRSRAKKRAAGSHSRSKRSQPASRRPSHSSETARRRRLPRSPPPRPWPCGHPPMSGGS